MIINLPVRIEDKDEEKAKVLIEKMKELEAKLKEIQEEHEKMRLELLKLVQ